MELEQGKNVDFWRDMTTITEDEISKLRKLEASGKGPGMNNCHFVQAEVLHSICLCLQLCFILGGKKKAFFLCLFSKQGDRREGINTAVSTDVQTVFKGKTYSQLQALHLNIESKIRAGGSNLDIGYWESLLQQVRVYLARAR